MKPIALPCLLIVLVTILFLCAFPLFPLSIFGLHDMLRNNLQLRKYSAEVYAYPLPPNSEIVVTNQSVGLGPGASGNHCDFIVEMTITSTLSEDEVITYYDGVTFSPARSDYQGFLDYSATGYHTPVPAFVHLIDTNEVTGQNTYEISVSDYGYPPGFDIRCR